MSAEQNKQAVRKFVDHVVNNGDLSVVDELIHPDYRDRSYPHTEDEKGPGVVRGWFPYLRQAYPDICHTIEDMVAEGDLVAWRSTHVGTQKGFFLGEKPTGKQARWAEVHFVRFKDGLMIEHWGPFSRKLVEDGAAARSQ